MGADLRETTPDIKSFESLFMRLQPGLFAYCMKYINDVQQAQDFVQECFMNLWSNLSEVSPSAYDAYLFRSMHNRCVSYFRSLRVREDYKANIKHTIESMAIHSEVPYPLTSLYMKEVSEVMERCVERLPEKCRRIFEMSRYRYMSNKEIGKELNLSVKTVEAQIYNALKILREELRDYLSLILLFYPGFF